MGFANNDSGRVSQSRYWATFAIYMVIVPLLLIGGFWALFQGNVALGMLMIVGILPLGIYWRVIMMRRCRDIGWPAFLPWVIFGLSFLASFSITSDPTSASVSSFFLVMAIALIDFAFSIVIGCIRSKQTPNYADVFDDGFPAPQRTRPAGTAQASGMSESDRFDDAIARALEAHRAQAGSAAPVQPSPAQRTAQPPAMPGRPTGGFGRRII